VGLRVLVRQVHLWLGLSLGLLLALLGLTGSALVFYVEIDAALNPVAEPAAAMARPTPGWDSAVWDQALATGRARFRDHAGDWSFEVTGTPGPIPTRYYPSSEHSGHHAEREMVWFSADGTRILRSEPWGGYLMSWLYELHMHLLAGENGRLVVGWGGLATLLLLATGVVAWWPRGSWRKALAFKRDAVPIRRLRDLHKLSGLWSALLLVLLVVTGGLLALPEVKTQVLASTVARPDPIPEPQSSAASGRQVPIAVALAAARAALPDARLAFIDVPGDAFGTIRMRVQVPGDPHVRFPGSFIFVDQYSGRVLAVHDIRQGNGATTVSAWIRPLHDGSIAGTGTRVLAIVLGLVPTVLLVTGLLHWRRRHAARRAHHPIRFKQQELPQ
jgi:uncharacterized iron-regulated membrane protein